MARGNIDAATARSAPCRYHPNTDRLKSAKRDCQLCTAGLVAKGATASMRNIVPLKIIAASTE